LAFDLALIKQGLTKEVLTNEFIGNASKDLKVKRVTPRHLHLAIRGDEGEWRFHRQNFLSFINFIPTFQSWTR
jgi:hypothetical protein